MIPRTSFHLFRQCTMMLRSKCLVFALVHSCVAFHRLRSRPHVDKYNHLETTNACLTRGHGNLLIRKEGVSREVIPTLTCCECVN